MSINTENRKYRAVFLGYLWEMAKSLYQSPNWDLLGVGIELNRKLSSEAIRFCEEQDIFWIDVKNLKKNNIFLDLIENEIDLIVVGAFGQIIPREILEIPRFGILNIHTSFLPYYKGCTPIEEQILRGDFKGGITLHWMTEKVDEGPIIAQQVIEIKPSYYYEDILHRYRSESEKVFSKLLNNAPENWPRIPQTKGEYNSPRREKDALLDWNLSSFELKRKVRAFGGRGWCKASLTDGKKILVSRAEIEENTCGKAPGQIISNKGSQLIIATKDGAIKILEWTDITKLHQS
jgi:methionyl-tRNA formyltransferase